MRERMRVTMSVKGVQNLRQILMIILFGALSYYMTIRAVSAIGQSERTQPAPQTQRPGETQTKPAPTPSADQTPTEAEPPPAQEQDISIKINSSLVAVPVSVTDASGEPVSNLGAEDFKIDEEGKEQQVVALGEPGKTPVELTLLFDVSSSVYERFQFQRQAASRFLHEVLKPKDAASIFTIGLRPKLVHPRVVGVDKAVAAALAVTPTKEATAFFDTVVEAAQYLGKTAEPGSRRVIVVISDGEDTVSENYRLGDALKELQRADCLFYSINPSGPSIRLNNISLKGHDGMVSLASTTGGAA